MVRMRSDFAAVLSAVTLFTIWRQDGVFCFRRIERRSDGRCSRDFGRTDAGIVAVQARAVDKIKIDMAAGRTGKAVSGIAESGKDIGKGRTETVGHGEREDLERRKGRRKTISAQLFWDAGKHGFCVDDGL